MDAPVYDPYLDSDTGLLRNLVDAQNEDELEQAEADLSYSRGIELSEARTPDIFDFERLSYIHHYLFQDVYNWAGTVRSIDMRKERTDSQFFMPRAKLELATAHVFKALAEEEYLRNLERNNFIDRLGYFYDQVNYLHPFREGNGRAQRRFWSEVAEKAGYFINWDAAEHAEIDATSIAAMEQGDLEPLRTLLERIVAAR